MKKLLFIIGLMPFLLFSNDAPATERVSSYKASSLSQYITFENNLEDISNVDHENGDAWESAIVYMNNVVFNPGEQKKVLLRKNDICLRIETPLNKWDDIGKLFGGKTRTVFKSAPFLQALVNKLPDHYTLSCHINFRLEDELLHETILEFSELVCHLTELLENKTLDITVRPHINPTPGLRINLYYKDTQPNENLTK